MLLSCIFFRNTKLEIQEDEKRIRKKQVESVAADLLSTDRTSVVAVICICGEHLRGADRANSKDRI